MKNFLQNLLLVLALGLCGLVAFQWHREAALRAEIQKLSDALRGQKEAAVGLQKRLWLAEEEGRRLSASRLEVTQILESNRVEIGSLKMKMDQTTTDLASQRAQAAAYKAALQQANDRITEQNDRLLKSAAERNEAVLRYNELVEEYADLVKKWNAQQEALSATNAAPRK